MNAPTSVEIGGWMACLFFLVAGFNQLFKIADRMKEKPPPAETYLTKTEFSAHSAQLTARFDRMESDLRVLAEKLDETSGEAAKLNELRASKMHERLNDIERNMPNQIVALLRNTGALK